LVTSKQFDNYIEIGDPVSQAKIYQAQAADELIFVDIDASIEGRTILLVDMIKNAAEQLFMPLTVGGGVKSLEDFRILLSNGADKVCLNTFAIENPNIINKASDMFGAQCVVLSIDYRLWKDGVHRVWSKCGSVKTDLDPVEWAIEGEKRGAGELMVTSIDKDGTRSGLDNEILRKIVDSVNIPVIASGGCGMAKHFIDGFKIGGADAISAGTYFCFKDENPMQIRSQIKNAGIPIRIHT
jgi:cyclase